MKLLTTYRKNGYDFQFIAKDGEWAVFHGTKPSSKSDNWEVVRLRVSPAGTSAFKDPKTGVVREVVFEERERAPCDSEWGDHGFTCLTRESAMERMHEQALKDATKKESAKQ